MMEVRALGLATSNVLFLPGRKLLLAPLQHQSVSPRAICDYDEGLGY
jgi:hypothetical protein